MLTTDAQNVIKQASDYAKTGAGATRVVVVGHTDSSGSDKYNLTLSQNRAKAVADGLVSNGVAQSKVQTDFKGESQLAVPTGDGVKEPLNRRSTVSVAF